MTETERLKSDNVKCTPYSLLLTQSSHCHSCVRMSQADSGDTSRGPGDRSDLTRPDMLTPGAPVSTDWSSASLISLSLSSRGCEARPDSAHNNQLAIPGPRSPLPHTTHSVLAASQHWLILWMPRVTTNIWNKFSQQVWIKKNYIYH